MPLPNLRFLAACMVLMGLPAAFSAQELPVEAAGANVATASEAPAGSAPETPAPPADPAGADLRSGETGDTIPQPVPDGLPVVDTADPEAERLAAFVSHGMELWHVPGAAVAVLGAEEVRFRRGFGSTEFPDGRPVNEHTLFAIGSTTKAMVAAGILMLADEGKLTLDDRVVQHLPELHFSDPLLTRQVTLRDLLTHRTGLPSTDFWTFFQEMPLAEQIDRLEAVAPQAGLRERLIYQNTMFELAGLVIERVTGKRWDTLLTEWLWHPIGMFETFGSRGQIGEDRTYVTPHFYLNQELDVAPWDLPEGLTHAAGSAWSSLHDMSLWAQFLLRGGITAQGRRLISAERFAEMFEPQQLVDEETFYPTAELTQPHWRSYGLGWFQQDFQGRQIDFHTGSLSGLIALVGLDRSNDRAVVVLGNRDHAEFRHAVLWEVMDTRIGDERPDWNLAIQDRYQRLRDEREAQWTETRQRRLANANTGLSLDAYIGSYRSKVNGDVVVGRSDRRLQFRTARITLEMRHWHLDTFLVEYEPWNLREFATFRIGTDGSVEALEVLGDSFRRLDPVPIDSGRRSGLR
jgi:CubicO group peptidase (beta-lactamase class C family)